MNPVEFLEVTKRTFGLVPMEGESFEEFQERASLTIHHKAVPLSDKLMKNIFGPKHKLRDRTAEVQAITEKYLGIEKEPIDAFYKQLSASMGGATIPESDGSSVVINGADRIMTPAIRREFIKGLEAMVSGRTYYGEVEEGTMNKVFKDAKILNDKVAGRVFASLYDEFLQDREFVGLHEGIHAIHINNHPMGLRGSKQPTIGDVISARLPFVGVIDDFKRTDMILESESFAYKLGIDAYVLALLDDIAETERFDDKAIDGMKEDIRETSTKFSKSIIRMGYLEAPIKGYGSASTRMTSALYKGAIGFALSRVGWGPLRIAGYLSLIGAADDLMRIPGGAILEGRINKTVDTLHKAEEVYGGPGPAFRELLGKRLGSMKKAVA